MNKIIKSILDFRITIRFIVIGLSLGAVITTSKKIWLPIIFIARPITLVPCKSQGINHLMAYGIFGIYIGYVKTENSGRRNNGK
jgi:hypothetical protein